MPSSADDLRAMLDRDRRASPSTTGGSSLASRLPNRGAGAARSTAPGRPGPGASFEHLRAQVEGAPAAGDGPSGSDGRPETLAEALPPVGDVRAVDALIAPEDVGPRPASTLQRTWIDPEETPFEPVVRPGNAFTARLISWTVLAAFLSALGWLIIPELNFRLANLNTMMLEDGVLSAQPVPLAPIRPAIVTELYVDASRLPDGVLREGTPIARIQGMAEDGERLEVSDIRVPFDARFVSVDTLVGGVVMPGTPVATIYDPEQMYVIVTIRPEILHQLRRGMKVRLRSDVIDGIITGEIISAVPLLGTDHEPTTADLVNIRIKPDPAAIADLVPGIRFDVAVDLSSAPPNAQPLVFTYAGHVDLDETEATDEADTTVDTGTDAEDTTGVETDGATTTTTDDGTDSAEGADAGSADDAGAGDTAEERDG